MNRRIAVILHGPPATGKTALSEQLRQRLSAKHISLDEGWFPGDARFKGGPDRYAEIASATDNVLLIELGCGEPVDLSFDGATRGAAEWISVLQRSGREVFGFRLCADPDDAAKRIEERLNRWIQEKRMERTNKLFAFWQFLGLHFLDQMRHPIATFPEIDGFVETEIVTTGRSESECADQIMIAVGLAGPAATSSA